MPIAGFEDVSGDMFKALEEAGHGRRLVIADRSLDIDRSRHVVVDYRGSTSAQALGTVLRLIQREGPVTVMDRDRNDKTELGVAALRAFERVAREFQLGGEDFVKLPRLSEEAPEGVGFYDLIEGGERSLYVRTPDPNPYACATFIVGHAQTGVPINIGHAQTRGAAAHSSYDSDPGMSGG